MRTSLELHPPLPPHLPSLSDGALPLEFPPSVFGRIWGTLTALQDFRKIDSLDLKLLRPADSQRQTILLHKHTTGPTSRQINK